MALLRLLCLPSTSFFPTQQFFSPKLSFSSLHKPPHSNSSLSPPPLSLSTSPIKTHKPTRFLFHVSSAQAQTEIETPEIEEEEDEGSRTRLLAQNVPWTCTEDDIRPLFEKYGTVVDIELSMHSKTRNRGLVFVSMSSHEEALAAFENLESYEFEGRTLKLTWARPRKTKPPSPPIQSKPVPVHNLFVANLPFQARAKDLQEFFNAENANVVSAEIIFHENPRGSAGYGFVSFNTKEEAEAALSAFQGKMFMGRAIRVAPSKRFLRQSTKLNIQSKDASSESKNEAEPAPTSNEG